MHILSIIVSELLGKYATFFFYVPFFTYICSSIFGFSIIWLGVQRKNNAHANDEISDGSIMITVSLCGICVLISCLAGDIAVKDDPRNLYNIWSLACFSSILVCLFYDFILMKKKKAWQALVERVFGAVLVLPMVFVSFTMFNLTGDAIRHSFAFSKYIFIAYFLSVSIFFLSIVFLSSSTQPVKNRLKAFFALGLCGLGVFSMLLFNGNKLDCGVRKPTLEVRSTQDIGQGLFLPVEECRTVKGLGRFFSLILRIQAHLSSDKVENVNQNLAITQTSAAPRPLHKLLICVVICCSAIILGLLSQLSGFKGISWKISASVFIAISSLTLLRGCITFAKHPAVFVYAKAR